MIPKSLLVVAALACGVSSAPQVYRATGVEQPTAVGGGDFSKIAVATAEILPEITSAFEQISRAKTGRANPSDPAFTQDVISAFMPLARKGLFARAKAEGTGVSQTDLDRLNAAEAVIPSVNKFMESLRGTNFNTGTQTASAFRSGAIQSSHPTGELQLDTTGHGQYSGMVSATIELLPEISDIFQQIGTDPGRSDTNNPEFVQNVIMAFMPFSKKALLASAKAEGRVVRQEELDRLDAAQAVMPSVFNFMDSLRDSDFFDTQSASAFRTGSPQNPRLANLPSAFGPPGPNFVSSSNPTIGTAEPVNLPSIFESATPATLSQSAFPQEVGLPAARPQSAFYQQPAKPISSNSWISTSSAFSPVASHVYQSPKTPAIPVKSPAFPELTQFTLPQVYQAYIPTVPRASPGLTYYTYATQFS